MDPSQRLALEVAYETFEAAGIRLEDAFGSDTSCYAAQWANDYREILSRDPSSAPAHTITGTGTAMLSNRLSWFFDLKGPSLTINTACSSSMVAVHEACQGLRQGDAGKSIVLGSNIILGEDMFTYLRGQNFLAPDGKCKTFDAAADGYGRGEGVAALILQPVKAAVKEGNPIRAVIRGSWVNQNGRTKGITLPSVDAQVALIRKTYNSAGLGFQGTTYVETHGTGTKAGDPVELEAIAQTIGQSNEGGEDDKLLVGSVKPNIGHTEATAGLAGIIKGVLALESGLIPPNILLSNLNPANRLDQWRMKVPTALMKWPIRSGSLRRMSACSTGYGGTNAHVIMDDASSYLADAGIPGGIHFTSSVAQGSPSAGKQEVDSHTTAARLLMLSSNDEDGIKRQAHALREYCVGHKASAGFLDNLAYTLNSRRTTLQWQTPVSLSSTQGLDDALSSTSKAIRRPSIQPAICFVFTGQGAQWPQMGQMLYQQNESFRKSIQEADSHFRQVLTCAWGVVEELFKPAEKSRIEEPEIAQPLTTVLQVALVNMLRHCNVFPDSIVGHSSGEIAAAYCLGALSKEQAWTIAYYRGVFRPSRNGSMLAVGLPLAEAECAIRRTGCTEVVVACENSPQNVTLSGDSTQIEGLEADLKTTGVFARRLKVRTAYHSPHIREIAQLYQESIESNVPIPTSGAPKMYSAVSGKPIDACELTPGYWVQNLISQVKFSKAVQHMLADLSADDNVNTADGPKVVFVEVGPHAALQGPLKQIMASLGIKGVEYTAILSRQKDDAVNALLAMGTLSALGVPVNLANAQNMRAEYTTPNLLVDLPPYPWKHSQTFNAITPTMQANAAELSRSSIRCGRQICSMEWIPAPQDEHLGLANFKEADDIFLLLPEHPSSILLTVVEQITHQLQVLGSTPRTIIWPSDYQGTSGRHCIALVDVDDNRSLDMTMADFSALQFTMLRSKSLLWISSDDAAGSIIPGLARTVRNEVPGLDLRCLQVDLNHIDSESSLWKWIANNITQWPADNEFRWVKSRCLVPRVRRDQSLDLSPSPSGSTNSSGYGQRLRSDATYLIVGGFGGLGRSIASSLVEYGARHICFLSRSGASSAEARGLIANLESKGTNVSQFQADITNLASLEDAVMRCEAASPEIAGVFQCAMVLRDVTFGSMTHQDWKEATLPKTQGSANIVRALKHKVDFFVMLSSFTGVFGNRTQGNYVAACAYQDRLAFDLQRAGVNALALDIGVMREVGYLAEHGSKGALKEWEEPFGLREKELLELVSAAMFGKIPTQVIAGLPTAESAREAGIRRPFYLDDPKFTWISEVFSDSEPADSAYAETPRSNSLDVKKSLSTVASKSEARELISSAFCGTVASALQASVGDIDEGRPLHSHGLDSLTGIEIQSWLFNQLGTSVPQDALMAEQPISKLVDQIVDTCDMLPADLKA